MSSQRTERLTLLTDLHIKQDILSKVLSHVGLGVEASDNLLVTPPRSASDKKIYSFTYVPEYIETVLAHPGTWTKKYYPSVHGYAIDLQVYDQVDDYMRKHLNKRRKSIARSVRRLEQSFDTTYKMYWGDIDAKQYDFLMGRLKAMIIRRFEQKGHESDNLAEWDKVVSTSLELIQAKKASLFVIYDREEPIVISFNYNYGPILFSYISSYDIDYGKFSPGQIEIYKQLEWCLDHGYTRFDMGWGGMGYKQWWSNQKYRFYHHIYYPENSLRGWLFALLKGNRSSLMAYLISKGVNIYINRAKDLLKKKTEMDNKRLDYKFEDSDLPSIEHLEPIPLEQVKLPMTKEIINDFLFLAQEHTKDVSLYHDHSEQSYFLKGKKKTQKVLFNHSTD